MSLTVTQRPNVNGVWVAAKNPVIYKMTRKDFTWTTLVTSAGNTSIQIATDVTASFVAGDTIWLQSDDGAYSASGTVVSSAFGAATTVITTVPYVANNTSGYINITSRRPNYYVGVGIYKSTDNTLIGTVNYYPTTVGLLTIDVSQPIQSVLDPSITSLTNAVIIQDSNVTRGFYIKYTEYWTGSANSATNDSGSVSYAVYGAKQIGSDSYLHDYLASLPLTKFTALTLAINEYYAISYISQNGGQVDWMKKSWYDASGTLLCITFLKSTDNTTAYAATNVPKSVYTLSQKFTLSESISNHLDRNITNVGTISWSSNSLVLGTGNTAKSWCVPFFIAQNKSITFTYDITLTGNSNTVTPHLYFFDSTGTTLSGSVSLFTGSNGNYTGTASITNSGSADAYFVGIDFQNFTGANKTMAINSLTVIIPDSCTRVDFQGKTISNSTTYSETGTLFNTISGNVITCTKNPITLFWRNSLGGQSSFTFNFSQDYLFKFQEPYKRKGYILYDNDLTLDQYNALNELFTLGQIYQTPLIELTTSIDKTEARIGQQVYIIDSSGTKTGVIVLPTDNKTLTKRKKHTIQVPIELPQLFE